MTPKEIASQLRELADKIDSSIVLPPCRSCKSSQVRLTRKQIYGYGAQRYFIEIFCEKCTYFSHYESDDLESMGLRL